MSTSNIFLPASLGTFAGILLGTIAGIDIVSTLILAAACAVLGVAVPEGMQGLVIGQVALDARALEILARDAGGLVHVPGEAVGKGEVLARARGGIPAPGRLLQDGDARFDVAGEYLGQAEVVA